MNGDFLRELIGSIVYLLPVLALVWKFALMTSRISFLENAVQEKTEKFCKEVKELQEKAEQERLATDSSISSVMNTLVEIQKSIVRIETKLDIGEKK